MNNKNYCDNCGNCSRCGNCCAALIPLTRKEEKKIRKYILDKDIKPQLFQENNDINLQCCFYDRNSKSCKIYEVRPKICRSYKCNRDENILILERNKNHEKAYWNNIVNDKVNNITDMRLLFYDDPRSLIANIVYMVTNGTMKCNKNQFEFVKKMLKECGQAELVECITEEYIC